MRTIKPLPAALLEGKSLADDPFFQAPVGAGPFQLVSWTTGADFVMTASYTNYSNPERDTLLEEACRTASTRRRTSTRMPGLC